MSERAVMDGKRVGLISELAKLYYLEDVPKTEIARRHGLSRFKVARLLEEARDQGIVRIEIRETAQQQDQLADRLATHLGLRRCVVVSSTGGDWEVRERVAQSAAELVSARLRSGDSLGVSWGRTMLAMAHHLHDLPPTSVVAITGMVGNNLSESPVEILRTIADVGAVATYPVLAPLFTSAEQGADTLRSDPAIGRTLSRMKQLDLAVMSVGSWKPRITQVADALTGAEHELLNRVGARAEILGIFLDDDGQLVAPSLGRRRLAATPDDLMGVPEVIAAAGGANRALALRAVACSGLITTLVTDDHTALALLERPAVTHKVWSRTR